MKGEARFTRYNYPRNRKPETNCVICGEATQLQSYVYLTAHNKIKLIYLCELHDNSHRIWGGELEVFKGCKIAGCLNPLKCKEMCKKHYQRFFIGSPVVQ